LIDPSAQLQGEPVRPVMFDEQSPAMDGFAAVEYMFANPALRAFLDQSGGIGLSRPRHGTIAAMMTH